nr:putative alpha,alpha-trehalose-phosphate synthase [udp-forming] 106 kda [Quercus suber]
MLRFLIAKPQLYCTVDEFDFIFILADAVAVPEAYVVQWTTSLADRAVKGAREINIYPVTRTGPSLITTAVPRLTERLTALIMATTLHVSLFLPNTIAFHNTESSPDTASPSPLVTPINRRASAADVPPRSSQPSLLAGPTPPLTTSSSEEYFTVKHAATDSQKLMFAKPGDPRSLVRSDPSVPEWGSQAIFNQPRYKAVPLPSGSILDFAKVHEELAAKQRLEARQNTTSPHSRATSRAQSKDRGYEGKSWTVEPAVHGNGGLTNAVRSAVNAGSIDATWIGTVGFPTDELPASLKDDIHDKLVNEHNSVVVFPSDKDIDGHYAHYCKTVLWPIFHYQVPDHPKSKAYADHSWEFYSNVNKAFAKVIVANYKRGDTIWIHDYHLLLLPDLVRKKLPDAEIGFFLHTAFPSSEVFRCLSMRDELLTGMLGANLVAFQTEEYATHFLQTCSRLLTVETTTEGVQLDEHFVNVTSEPIGIDPDAIEMAREEDDVRECVQELQERYKDKKIIVARDKLDNIRGVRQKLLAYELFLNKYPEWAGKVVLIQVATSTSEHSELLTTVSDICTRIASVHSTLSHQPLVFLKQDIPFSQYLALLTVADVLIISALRDGMNLTAHEYIYCQDGRGSHKKHGPLILSEFTGSATVLRGHQISINPWHYQQQADAIKLALDMDEQTKAEHWQRLHEIIMTKTARAWAEGLIKDLTKVHEEHKQRASSSVPRLSVTRLNAKYNTAQRRLFIIDYEGTLAPHRTSIGIPLSSQQRVLDALMGLMADPKNIVYVMSGRRPQEMESTFRALPALGLIAENGCFMREYEAGSNKWQGFTDEEDTEKWKKDVMGILTYYKDRVENSYIEERNCSLLFRYEKCVDWSSAMRQAGESADQINSSCKVLGIHAVPIPKAVLVEQTEFTKATAAKHIFAHLRQKLITQGEITPDFMLIAGDDREDEVIFHWANELGEQKVVQDVFTVSVGHRNTEAQATLTQGSTGLLTALAKLANVATDRPARKQSLHQERND